MKKNASFIMMDSALAQSLYQTLETLPVQSAYAEELRQGLRDLLDGDAATLVLGLAGHSESLAGLMDDGIYAGALEIHPKSRRVLYDGKEIGLTPKEFDILHFLAKNKGEVFTKEQIYQAVWAEDYLMASAFPATPVLAPYFSFMAPIWSSRSPFLVVPRSRYRAAASEWAYFLIRSFKGDVFFKGTPSS